MKTRITILVLVLIALAGGLIYFFSTTGPRERDRVVHPAGYSIVCPRGWSANMVAKSEGDWRDSISLKPDDWKGLVPEIWVRRFATPPSIDQLKARSFIEKDFNGLTAWGHQERPRKHTIRRVIFQDNGQWYEVAVSLPGIEALKLDDWWKYAETFRPAPAPESAASQPANQN